MKRKKARFCLYFAFGRSIARSNARSKYGIFESLRIYIKPKNRNKSHFLTLTRPHKATKTSKTVLLKLFIHKGLTVVLQ